MNNYPCDNPISNLCKKYRWWTRGYLNLYLMLFVSELDILIKEHGAAAIDAPFFKYQKGYYTVLWSAVSKRNYTLVKILLKRGAKVNIEMLQSCVHYCNHKILKLLLSFSPSYLVNIVQMYNKSLLLRAIEYQVWPYQYFPDGYKAPNQIDKNKMLNILLEFGALIKPIDLVTAVKNCDINSVSILFNHTSYIDPVLINVLLDYAKQYQIINTKIHPSEYIVPSQADKEKMMKILKENIILLLLQNSTIKSGGLFTTNIINTIVEYYCLELTKTIS